MNGNISTGIGKRIRTEIYGGQQDGRAGKHVGVGCFVSTTEWRTVDGGGQTAALWSLANLQPPIVAR